MKVSFLSFLLLFLSCSYISHSQGWKWATGSSCPKAVIEDGPVAVDKKGNVYAIGNVQQYLVPVSPLISIFGTDTLRDSSDLGSQIVLASTDSNGNYRWAIGTQNGRVQSYNMTIDPYDNIYILGRFTTGVRFGAHACVPSGSGRSFCAKVNSAGTVLWVKEVASNAHGDRLCISETGSIYITGTYDATCSIGTSSLVHATTNTNPDVFIAKYDSSFNPVWAKGFGGKGTEYVYGISVTPDSQKYVTGLYNSDTMLIDTCTLINPTAGAEMYIYVAKFSASGTPLWGKSLAVASFSTYVAGCTTDNRGSVYVTGAYHGAFSFGPYALPTITGFNAGAFLGKYDSAGNAKWARVVPDTNIFSSNMVTLDKCGNLWICGQGGPYPDTLYPYNPAFVARYDTAGNFVDSMFLVQGGDDGSAIALDNRGYLYLSSNYGASFKLGPDSVKVQDSTVQAMYIAKYLYQYPNCVPIPAPNHAAVKDPANVEPDILIYPNPAASDIVISSSTIFAQHSRAELYDMTGVLRQSYPLTGKEPSISVSGYPPGVYQCRIYITGSAVANRKLVIMR